MKIFSRFLILILLISAIFMGCTRVNKALKPSQMTFKPLEFSIPSAERVVLDNGMIVYIKEDHELPLLDLSILVRTGGIYDPDDKIGLAEITGSVMRTGGTRFNTGSEINEKLEFVAGSIETGIGEEMGSASLSVLKKDTDLGLKLLADILISPVFDEKKIELKKKKILEYIRRQNDDPKSIASREFNKIIYRGHPYGRYKTRETVNNIERKDLIDFHKKYFHPNNIILGVTGDFSKKEILKKLNGVFGNWKKADTVFPKIKPLEKKFYNSVNYVNKDIVQTVVKVGHLGIKHKNPDFFTLKLMNYILGGGGFQSRLMKEIRSDKGLAYAIWSTFGAGHREFGVFNVSCETKTESTIEVIESIKENIKRIMENPVSDKELEIAKNHIINSFIFRFTSIEQVVNQLMTIEYFDISEDYLANYRKNIAKVTKEDIMAVAQKYLNPDKLVFMVVGNEEKFDGKLSRFGELNTIKLEEETR